MLSLVITAHQSPETGSSSERPRSRDPGDLALDDRLLFLQHDLQEVQERTQVCAQDWEAALGASSAVALITGLHDLDANVHALARKLRRLAREIGSR